MIISRKIDPYVVYDDESIQHALNKISQNTRRLVFCVSNSGILRGIVTDGDFRRWVVKVPSEVDLHKPVRLIANSDCVSMHEDASFSSLKRLLSRKISAIPLTDHSGRLKSIAWFGEPAFRFGDREISHEASAFVIAEIGNNHNGSLDLAKRLIEAAADAGADCAKFQLRDMDSLYLRRPISVSEDLGSEYTTDLLRRFQLSVDEMFAALDFTRECGLVPLCTPWDQKSLYRLNDYGIEGFKISSADLTNHALLEDASSTRKLLLVSTGMAEEHEIQESVALLKQQGAPFCLLHCNSTYPTPLRDVNLAYMDRLQEISNGPVGYSGHERGYEVCIAAVARGAKIIEKHFTLDRSMEGNDHRVSLLPTEFKAMVNAIRNVEEALGCGFDRKISQGERLNREVLAKSLVASVEIKKGEKITSSMINICSPGHGLQPSRLRSLLGISASRDMEPGEVFFESDILGESSRPRSYVFDRPWGIPVRYHDFNELTKDVRMNFVEIHFSYRDLELEPSNFFELTTDLGLVVHSPELFSGDHLMDLSSDDDDYRYRSINELQRVINRTRELKRYFPSTKNPMIIINAGGFTADRFLPEGERQPLYDRIAESIFSLDSEGIELIPQTMPPFPWHFGGQRYHNLFMNPEEIARFCRTYSMRVCYDTSHSKLACNYFGWSLHEFTKMIGQHTGHIHVVDARGHHDEGLQIGEGEIDFISLGNDLTQCAPGVSFIPEIWQGHKNGGEGFWLALDRLEKSFSGSSSVSSRAGQS